MSEVSAASLGATAFAEPSPEPSIPQTLTLRSEWDDVYGVVARRSEASARIVRECPSALDAMRATLRWIATYMARHDLGAHEIRITGSMSPEGAIVLRIGSVYDEQ